MTAAAPQRPPAVALTAQADLLLAASRLFGLPGAELLREVETLGPSLDDLLSAAAGSQGEGLSKAALGLRGAAGAPDLSALQEEHSRLFDTALACPINETAFVRRDKGAILGDVAGFYRAFGFALADGAGEKVDHLACELEFFALLLVMRAQAEEQGNREAADVTRGAIESFAFDHLGEWLPLFCTRLQDTATHPFYRHAAAFLEAVWQLVAGANSLPLPAPEDGREPLFEADTPYECGMAETDSG
jgi:TorA maturation chaperone TorD